MILCDQGAKDRKLSDMIESLHSDGRLPSGLKAVADQVKDLGNEAAHRDVHEWEFPKPGKRVKSEEIYMWLGLSRVMVGWFYLPDEVNQDFDRMSAITGQDPGSS